MSENRKKEAKKRKYRKPEIIFEKQIEVVSAVCSSSFGGLSGCRTMGTCARARA